MACCCVLLGAAALLVLVLWTRRPVLALVLRIELSWVDMRTGQPASRTRLAATAVYEAAYVILSLGFGAVVSSILACGKGRTSVSEGLARVQLMKSRRLIFE